MKGIMKRSAQRWWQRVTTNHECESAIAVFEFSTHNAGRGRKGIPAPPGGTDLNCRIDGRLTGQETKGGLSMCRVFAEQDPEGYRQINRSIRIGGHSTSIQLESTFWALLDEIAESQGLTTPKFISKLYDEAIEIRGEIPNFASMLRTTCALYLRGGRPLPEEVAALKQEAA
jgi:predicted DNA-binding ribbon-helix-helix protein